MLKFRGPGLAAALIAAVNMVFAWFFLKESHDAAAVRASGKTVTRSGDALLRVVSHSGEPASRLIWIYGFTMGAFMAMNTVLALLLMVKFAVTENTFGYFFTYVAVIGVVVRAFVLGKLVAWLKEPRLSRIGMVMLAVGLFTMPLAPSVPVFALCVALVPLGTAFTFPCVTSLLSQVVPQHERGLYMGVQQTFGGRGPRARAALRGFRVRPRRSLGAVLRGGHHRAVHDSTRFRNGEVREAALRRRDALSCLRGRSQAPGSLSRTAFAISTMGFERSWLERWRMR